MRLQSETLRGRARRGPAISRSCVAQGRSPLLLLEQPSGARRRGSVLRPHGRARVGVSRQLMVGGGAQQSGHVLHPRGQRRGGGRNVQGTVPAVSCRGAVGTCRVEIRVVGLHEGELRRNSARVRKRRRDVSALGLPSVIPVLGRPIAREAGPAGPGRVAPAPGLYRLRELVLWTAGGPATGAARRGVST